MTYERITWVPDVLRKAGLQVVEYDGWRARGLSETRTFDPDSVIWHHDASAPGDSPGVVQSRMACPFPLVCTDSHSIAAAKARMDRVPSTPSAQRARW